MKLQLVLLLLSLTQLSYGQTQYSQVTIYKNAGLSSSLLFGTEKKSIQFNLAQRINNFDDTTEFVAVNVQNIGEKKVGSSASVGINANLGFSFGSGAITEVYSREGYLELTKEEFKEVYEFINSSMGKANPMQELQASYNILIADKLGISLIYDQDKWGYIFSLNGAQYQVDFQESINIILELKEMNEFFQSNFK